MAVALRQEERSVQLLEFLWAESPEGRAHLTPPRISIVWRSLWRFMGTHKCCIEGGVIVGSPGALSWGNPRMQVSELTLGALC